MNEQNYPDISSLPPKTRENLKRLAKIRGESETVTFAQVGLEPIAKLPRSFKENVRDLFGVEFIEAGVRDELAYVQLSNGRIFYGHRSRPLDIRVFNCIKDKLSPVVTPDTYRIARDVAYRYFGERFWLRREFLPNKGGTIVEVGAFCGHKTMRFVDEVVGSSGKVLAIEVLPDNIAPLRRNVMENGLQDCIDILESGVWKERGTMLLHSKGQQRNSLVDFDGFVADKKIEVRTDTLNNILSTWEAKVINFLAIMVNSAELEVLQGMDEVIDRIEVIYVVASYERNGATTYRDCVQFLQDKGCHIAPASTGKIIYAVGSRYVDKYAEYLTI